MGENRLTDSKETTVNSESIVFATFLPCMSQRNSNLDFVFLVTRERLVSFFFFKLYIGERMQYMILYLLLQKSLEQCPLLASCRIERENSILDRELNPGL